MRAVLHRAPGHLVLLALVLAGCGDAPAPAIDLGTDRTPPSDTAPDLAADVPVDRGPDRDPIDPGPNELPCDVKAVVEELCAHCHASPPSAEAPMPLLSRAHFLEPSPEPGKSFGELSVERIRDAADPMPPRSEPVPDPTKLAVLEAWVEAGMPAGSCGALPEKPLPTTCASGSFWKGGNRRDREMNPGRPCRACHLEQAPELAFFFSGTVFASFHEQDLCNSPPPDGARIEILDEQGTVTATLVPNAVGSFTSVSTAPGVPLPYRARLIAGGRAREMRTPQTSGDCNACHTEQGDNDAPGRLVWPAQ